jgi:hypothetical protein
MLLKLTAGKVAEGDKFALKKVTNETVRNPQQRQIVNLSLKFPNVNQLCSFLMLYSVGCLMFRIRKTYFNILKYLSL